MKKIIKISSGAAQLRSITHKQRESFSCFSELSVKKREGKRIRNQGTLSCKEKEQEKYKMCRKKMAVLATNEESKCEKKKASVTVYITIFLK